MVITSNKGLSGAFNANLVRYTLKVVQDYQDKGIGCELFIVGQKGYNALKRVAKYGVTCKVLSKSEINDEHIILPILQKFSIDFIVLAGFMLIVPEFIINKYYNNARQHY